MAAPKFAPRYKPANIAAKAYEVEAMVGVLEADYKDVKQAARKAVSAAFALMAERNWFAIVSTLDGKTPTLYGVFATESAALKALEQNSLALFGTAYVVEIKGLSERAFDIGRWEDEGRKPCALCGHDDYAHAWPRARRPGCVVGGCGCATHIKPAPVIPPVAAI